MQTTTIIVPIVAQSFDLKQNTKKLSDFLKKNKADFNVIFAMPDIFEKPKNFKNTEKIKLLTVKETSLNGLIATAFQAVKDSAVIVLDMTLICWEDALSKLINEAGNKSIVRVQFDKKRSKFSAHIAKFLTSIYYSYLKRLHIEKDLMLSNTLQYFGADAVQIINTLPQKNAYLRNFNCLLGFEQKTVVLDEKESKAKNKFLIWTKQAVLGAVFTAVGVLSVPILFVFSTAVFSMQAGLGYFLILLTIVASVALFGGYLIVKTILRQRFHSIKE